MKRELFYILSIITLFILVIASHLEHKKNIKNILYQDSLKYELVNKKVLHLDSLNIILSKSDSVQSLKIDKFKSNYKNTSTNYTNSKKKYEKTKNGLPVLPDLGQ